MITAVRDVRHAVVMVLQSLNASIVFLLSSIAVFLLLLMVPVWTTPGNDVLFQLHLLKYWVIALMVLLSLGNGLVITMQLYIRKHRPHKTSATQKGKEAVTFGGLLVAAVTSTLACAACYSALLSLFGLGAATFVVRYQPVIATVAILLTMYAIVQAAKRINNHCEVCEVHPHG